jgi:hypothetical protein
MSTKFCKVFVSLDRLSTAQRRDAAFWAIQQFGEDGVDLWHPKDNVPGFWFKTDQDAFLFLLKYAQ